jgi:hypothetical protein
MSRQFPDFPLSVDKERAAKIGRFHIDAETDGASVRFDILKSPVGGPRPTRDPYVRRFGAGGPHGLGRGPFLGR